MIYSNDLFEVFSMGQMGNLDQIAPQIYATLYLMIHSKDICEMLSVIMAYNW